MNMIQVVHDGFCIDRKGDELIMIELYTVVVQRKYVLGDSVEPEGEKLTYLFHCDDVQIKGRYHSMEGKYAHSYLPILKNNLRELKP